MNKVINIVNDGLCLYDNKYLYVYDSILTLVEWTP